MTSLDTQANTVDSSSTSLTKTDVLERQLQNRPDAEFLERRGILKQGGTLAAQRSDLEHELLKRTMGRQIQTRPDYSDLVHAGIAPDSEVAPSLQAAAKLLSRNLKADRLSQHLSHRMEPEKVSDLLPAGHVAPRLRSTQMALEKAFARDHLNHMLSSRPDTEELVQMNILKSTVAPSLQAAQQRLYKQMKADRISNLIESRARQQTLEKENILQDHRVAASLQPAQCDLRRNLTKATLFHALQTRPTRHDLEERGILTPESFAGDDASLMEKNSTAKVISEANDVTDTSPFQQRSRQFVLTRLLLKFVVNLSEAGEISIQQKGYLKDLIVDQDPATLAAAEVFEADGQIDEFKDTLLRLLTRSN